MRSGEKVDVAVEACSKEERNEGAGGCRRSDTNLSRSSMFFPEGKFLII